MQRFRGDVPVALREHEPAERQALAGRAKADIAEHGAHVMERAAGAVTRGLLDAKTFDRKFEVVFLEYRTEVRTIG